MQNYTRVASLSPHETFMDDFNLFIGSARISYGAAICATLSILASVGGLPGALSMTVASEIPGGVIQRLRAGFAAGSCRCLVRPSLRRK